jgi:ubiquinone/menaquinone biosynthesis C-methylase UbiE
VTGTILGTVSLYGNLFAALYDRVMADTEKAGLHDRRRELLSGLSGRVVEIGGGTGVNLELYPATVTEVVTCEPEEPMARRLEGKLGGASVPVRVVRAPAESLPFEDGTFDHAVSTLVLCTVDDPAKSLSELRRVLKPDGTLVFLEHVRADEAALARWQDRLHPLWVRVGHGCHCNRPTLDTIRAAGFTVDDVDHGRLPKAPPIVRPMIAGVAARSPG